MNNVYNIVWSTARQCWMVVSELCRRSSCCGGKAAAVALVAGAVSHGAQAAITINPGDELKVWLANDDSPSGRLKLTEDYVNNGLLTVVGSGAYATTDVNYNGVISGTGDLSMEYGNPSPGQSTGTLVLTRANTYSGQTRITNASVVLKDAGRIAGDLVLSSRGRVSGFQQGNYSEFIINRLDAPGYTIKSLAERARFILQAPMSPCWGIILLWVG